MIRLLKDEEIATGGGPNGGVDDNELDQMEREYVAHALAREFLGDDDDDDLNRPSNGVD